MTRTKTPTEATGGETRTMTTMMTMMMTNGDETKRVRKRRQDKVRKQDDKTLGETK